MIGIFLRLSAVMLMMLPTIALAWVVPLGAPDTPCTGLIGCPGAGNGPVIPANVVVNNLSQAANLMVLVAAALSVVFIVYAGFRMVIAMGDDSQITEQKHAVIYVLVGLLFVILSQLIVSFVGTQDYGQNATTFDNFFVDASKSAVSILLTVFNAVMVVAIIIGGGYMVHSQGKSDQFTKGKTIVTWPIAGALFANLANALVQALVRLFDVT